MPLPSSQSSALQSLLSALLNLQTSASSSASKRYYSYLFRDLPDKVEYQDYYLFIKEPRCLNGIMDSLKKGIYSSPQAVAYDLFLVWQNAREYNEQGSQVFNDSEKLESYMQKLWTDRSPPLPAYSLLPRPGTLPPAASTSSTSLNDPAPPRKHKKIKLTSSSLAAAAPPPPPSSSASANSKKRISVVLPEPSPAPSTSKPSITLKLKAPTSSTTATAITTTSASDSTGPSGLLPALTLHPKREDVDDDPTPRKRSRGVDEDVDFYDGAPDDAGSPGYGEGKKSSTRKERRAKEKAERALAAMSAQADQGLEDSPRTATTPQPESMASAPKASLIASVTNTPSGSGGGGAGANAAGAGIIHVNFGGIPDEDPGWFSGDLGDDPTPIYLDIVKRLKEHTDVNGRILATPLMTLPDPQTKPEYYKQIKNPVALDTIQERIIHHHYATPEAFDRDLFQLFQIAKRYIKPDTPGPIYTDLIVLQRLYQELTKRVLRSEPARPLPASGAASAAALSSVSVGPGNIQQKRADSPGVGETEGGAKNYSSGRVTMKDKVFLDGINFKGEILRCGDWVHLLNPDNPAKPVIAQIFKVWKKPDSAQRCISVCWYYRPEETVHPASRQFYEHEVFKTSNFVDHSVEDVIERCFVMFFTRYVRGRPKPPYWWPGLPLYVVEHRYKDDLKSFKKIKNWNSCVPEEIRKNEYELDIFPDERVETLPRVKSPFVRGLVGPGGIGEAMENEEEEQARYHFLPSGEPATVQRLRAAKEAEMAAQAQANSSMALYGHQAVSNPLLPPPQQRSTQLPFGSVSRPMQVPMPFGSSTFQLPAPTPPLSLGLTPAELAITTESFKPIPPSIQSKFRTDVEGDLLWFAAPPAAPPVAKRAHHSLDYILWKAKKSGFVGGGPTKSNGLADVVMDEA